MKMFKKIENEWLFYIEIMLNKFDNTVKYNSIMNNFCNTTTLNNTSNQRLI